MPVPLGRPGTGACPRSAPPARHASFTALCMNYTKHRSGSSRPRGDGDAPLCYVERHATPVVNGTITEEGLARAKAPWFSLEPGDQASSLAIDGFAADGAFKGGKLGIIVDVQAQNTYDDVVKQALARNK